MRLLLKGALALFMLLQLALVQVMAASPSIHDALHHHGERPDQPPCAVALWLATGGGDPPAPVAAPAPAELPVTTTAEAPSAPLLSPTHLRGGIAAHSPPRAP